MIIGHLNAKALGVVVAIDTFINVHANEIEELDEAILYHIERILTEIGIILEFIERKYSEREAPDACEGAE